MKKLLLFCSLFLLSIIAYGQDVWLQNHFSPNSGFRLSNSETVTVLINNNSAVIMPSNTITVKYQVDNGAVVSQLLSSNLTAGASWNFSFNVKADLSAFGAHTIKVWVERPGDTNNLNNEFTWTVNNTCIEMNQPANVSNVCGGTATPAINFTSNLANVGYTWTNSNPAIGLAASGLGGIPSFTAVNTGTSTLTSTITVRPHYVASQTFNYTGAMQTYVVPAGVTKIKIDARGAQGESAIYNQPGTRPDDLGGKGGRVVAEYPVTPGQTIYVFVGGNTGYNGGGNGGGSVVQPKGGGASDIRIGGTALTNRIIVAGGGGGGGNNCAANAEPGGAGGGLIGETGYQCNSQTGAYTGMGGTQSAGGVAGVGTSSGGSTPATAGQLGLGGNGGIFFGTAAGGGGGGYYGGGGAAYGGGGGGSSYTASLATSVVHTQGFQDGSGQIIISYYNDECGSAYEKTFTITVKPQPIISSLTPASQSVASAQTIAFITPVSSLTGTTFTWTRDNSVNVTGMPTSGNGTISGSLTNTTTTAQTVTFTVTPHNNGCDGPSATATVLINASMPDASGVLYVKKGNNGTGESWASPIAELGDALVVAKNLNTATPGSVKQIWVAGGVYKPMYSPADNNFGVADGRNNAFLLVKDVKVYGGFAGTETTLTQRDLSIVANKSTLSGDFNDDDIITGSGATLIFTNKSENASNVLLSVGDVGTATLNGFTISGGAGVGSNTTINNLPVWRSYGGGMHVYSSSPMISNCTFQYNNVQTGMGGALYIATPNNGVTAAPIISQSNFLNNSSNNIPGQGWGDEGGGALYIASSSPVISDCSFVGNLATGNRFGGAIVNVGSATKLANVIIQNNVSLGANAVGGGLANYGIETLTLTNIILSGNNAGANGGAIYNSTGSAPSLMNNVLISGNTANNGGGIYNSNSSPVLTNVTISGNQGSLGGGIYNSQGSSPQLQNTVVFGNSSGVTNNATADVPVYRNSLVQDINGAGLINFNGVASDLFMSPLSQGLATGGDYRPKEGSPLINAGDQTLFLGLNASTKDLAGNLRLVGGNIDLGPYEVSIQSQTITVTNLSKTYGDTDFEPGATASSGLMVSYVSSDNNIAEAYQDATDNNKWKLKVKKVGTVNITASQAGGNGYSAATDQVFVLTIQPRALTITATGNAKVYDAAINAAVSLLHNGISGDQLNVTYATANFNDKNVGNNKTILVSGITLSGASATNYTFNTTATTTANITPFALTVSAIANNKVYDATTVAAVSLSSNAFAGDALTLNYASANFNDQNVGTGKTVNVIGISLSGADASNYTFATTGTSMADITPAVLNISAQAKTKTYGNLDPALTYTSAGLIGADAITGTLSRDAGANVGTYAIRQGTLSAGVNYTINYTSANFNIVAKVIAVNIDAKSKTYGDADPAITFTATSLIGNDTFTGSPVRDTGENVGTYVIGQGALTAGPNYNILFTPANLTINRAILTVTAANAARCFGQANPAFAVNYNGFKRNDNENSLATKPQTTTLATMTSQAGNYPITVSGAASNNYTFVYANGTLRVDALPAVAIIPSRQGTIGKGLTVTLSATGGTSYSWANASGIISGQNSATLSIRPTVSTTYTVTVTNANGCSSTVSYAVVVADDLSILKATNLLSPNGDGVNDVWKVENIDMYPQAMVRIFDKAGRMVYTRKGYDNSWDGTYNGQPLAENTYYYIIDLEAGKVLKGYITLVRDR